MNIKKKKHSETLISIHPVPLECDRIFVEFRSLSFFLVKIYVPFDSVQGNNNTIYEISTILRLTFTRSTRLNKLHSFVAVHDAFQLHYL